MSALWMTVFFAMLWLPLGQHDFLVPHWMKLGTFMAPLMLMMHYQDREGSGASDIRGVSVWMLVLYIAHQFEEHWIDLLGNHCAFYPSVNQLLAAVLERQQRL